MTSGYPPDEPESVGQRLRDQLSGYQSEPSPPAQVSSVPATAPPPDPDDGTGNSDNKLPVPSLGPILRLTPMLDLFCTVAERRYGHQKRRNPVAECKKDHPKLFACCIFIDATFRVAGSLMLLIAVGLVIYKTLWL